MTGDRDSGSGRLRLVEGGVRLGLGTRIHLVSDDQPPMPADATVYEEDTHLLLSAPSDIRGEPEHPIRLMTALVEARPTAPGTVLVRGRQPPYRLLAVVHDIDRSPTWCEAWVGECLAGVLAQADEKRLRSVALPVLGARHGKMDPVRFAELLREAVSVHDPATLSTVWLLLPPLSMERKRTIERTLAP